MDSMKDQVSVILEAGENMGLLASKLEALSAGPQDSGVTKWILCKLGQKWKVLGGLPSIYKSIPLVEADSLGEIQGKLQTPWAAFLPSDAPCGPLPTLPAGKVSGKIIPWIPPSILPQTRCSFLGFPAAGWISDRDFLQTAARGKNRPTLRDLEALDRTCKINQPYLSAPASLSPKPETSLDREPVLSSRSRVLALVPYFNCAEWLEQCLSSLAAQTRPLDGIVVMDDASLSSPLEIVRQFPNVTLLRSGKNVGPYRLVQSAIETTGYDAYLFQDPDDWSSLDRLELLMEEAEKTGAELVGTQEVTYLQDNVMASLYPLDVNRALEASHGYSLLHPSSLVSRRLVAKAGGYATGLRFSGDIEFLCRARLAGKIVNLDRYCYFRRIRKNSLITSETTGLASPARQALDRRILERYQENKKRAAEGLPPRLEPLESAEPVPLEHLCGPSLVKAQ